MARFHFELLSHVFAHLVRDEVIRRRLGRACPSGGFEARFSHRSLTRCKLPGQGVAFVVGGLSVVTAWHTSNYLAT
jgi:hypothetical protein